ncbi:LOW QUALITY PROTEIN: probable transcription factor At3g04930 [Hibiscus syriacus]|uniref:LOW QUALITY PROTEIN: probable transcription factor At3g04930 n=1 Tax=Hibiscus syriacus TaxID=106335 RepID=UPI00192465A5|nr:LOW QUALITY PROTEIN: probable transcription factor At3g04930 [Hibiscus syriacus]
MASEQYGAVFEEYQDDDEEPSSSGNDDVLNDNDEEDEELLEEEEDFNSPSLLPQPIAAVVSTDSIPAVPLLALPSSNVVTVAAFPIGELNPDSKRQRTDSVVSEKKPPLQPFDESRRLFQRLWTDEDEIELLKGFLDYTSSRTNPNSSSHHHHHDTALFYDLIKSKLQLDCNKNQLVEKLRRLKKKYRNVMNKINSGKDISFKSPHDQATFEISRKIWSDTVGKVEDNVLDYDENNINNNATNINLLDESGEKRNSTPKSPATKKRSRSKGGKMEEKRVLNDGFVISNNNFNNSDHDHAHVDGFGGGGGGGGGGERGNVAAVIEEAVKSCLTPLFKELLGSLMGGGGRGCGGRGISGLAMNAMPLNFGNFGYGSGGNGELIDERWRKQQILELEVYFKRLELVQDQIKAALEELRLMGG